MPRNNEYEYSIASLCSNVEHLLDLVIALYNTFEFGGLKNKKHSPGPAGVEYLRELYFGGVISQQATLWLKPKHDVSFKEIEHGTAEYYQSILSVLHHAKSHPRNYSFKQKDPSSGEYYSPTEYFESLGETIPQKVLAYQKDDNNKKYMAIYLLNKVPVQGSKY